MEKGEELAAVLAEIRQRVRARNPNGTVSGDISLPDLTPLLHARDAAEGKVASIGSVIFADAASTFLAQRLPPRAEPDRAVPGVGHADHLPDGRQRAGAFLSGCHDDDPSR